MSRYRPPVSRGSAYITAAGKIRLDTELAELWRRRAEVTVALSAAAAEGDRSENAEYIYRKKQLREMDRRIRYLQKRLEELVVVAQKPSDTSRVYFGAWVTLEDSDGNESRLRIVGPDEIDPDNNYISMDSPMGRALMKMAVDDEVTVSLPAGEKRYFIVHIEYPE